MPSNVTLNSGSGGSNVTTKQRSHDGDTTQQQMVSLSGVSGTEDSYTFVDIAAGNGTATNALRVTIANDSTGVGGTATDDSGFTVGTDSVAVMGALLDDTATDSVNEGDVGAVRMSSDRRLLCNVADGGGSLTVDGTVTANLSATDNAVLDSIDTAVSGTLTVDGSGVTQPVSGTVTANLSATDNGVLDNIDANTAAIQTAVETLDNAISGSEMQVDVVAALPAGTNNIGDVDVASIAAGSNLVGDVGLSGARTSGGTTIFRSIDLDQTEEQVKGTAGQVYWIHCMNLAASARYLKFYNATAASVTVGTTTPVMTFPIATQGDTNGAGFTLSIPNGIEFGTAITVAATTGIADNDTGAPGANEVIINLGYA